MDRTIESVSMLTEIDNVEHFRGPVFGNARE